MIGVFLFVVGFSVTELDEMHEREIAVSVKDSISGRVSDQVFLTCVPRESFPYSKTWSQELQDKIFAREAMGDLMKCSPKSCAFNFLPQELEPYSKLKSKEERRSKYFEFIDDRVNFKTGLDPDRTPYFLKSFDQAFDFCQSKAFDELLDKRPVKRFPFRASHIHYNRRMRQTTRLLQSISYPLESPAQGLCYAEALIFSDHYDLDRVEVWKIERTTGENPKTEIKVGVRHRIDLLSTWFRRLNKRALRDELKQILKTQMTEATDCMKGALEK